MTTNMNSENVMSNEKVAVCLKIYAAYRAQLAKVITRQMEWGNISKAPDEWEHAKELAMNSGYLFMSILNRVVEENPNIVAPKLIGTCLEHINRFFRLVDLDAPYLFIVNEFVTQGCIMSQVDEFIEMYGDKEEKGGENEEGSIT